MHLMDDQTPVPRLRTDRLLLREWRRGDLEPFAQLNADPAVAELLAGPLPREESDALAGRIVAGWRERGYGLWAVERIEEGMFLGFTGLSLPRWAPEPSVEIGWRLARHAWGHGYATEAARTAVRFAFEDLALDALVSYTAVTNARSRRVMERLGMHRDRPEPFDFLHPRLPEGHPLREHVTYRLSRAEWLASLGRSRDEHLGPSLHLDRIHDDPRSRSVQTVVMDKPTLLREMRRTHGDIESVSATLDVAALLAPAPGMDGWTRKDVLAHVEWWSDHSARVVTALLEGHEPYDARRILGHRRPQRTDPRGGPGTDAADVRSGEAAAFERVLAAVEAAPPDALFTAGRFAWLGRRPAGRAGRQRTRPEHYPEQRSAPISLAEVGTGHGVCSADDLEVRERGQHRLAADDRVPEGDRDLFVVTRQLRGDHDPVAPPCVTDPVPVPVPALARDDGPLWDVPSGDGCEPGHGWRPSDPDGAPAA